MDPTTSTPTAVIPANRSHRRTPTTGSGGREDCWSEGATDTLIEAWGDRYVNLNRGNLRQKDWKEVADAVNSRDNGVKPQRTDVQCKNRIDTLKKKYKIEKAKPPPSTWRFFPRLDSLIGSSNAAKKPTTTVTLTVRSAGKGNPVKQEASNSTEEEFDEEDDDGDDDDVLGFDERVKKKQHRMEDVDFSDGAACRELARAILKFGEIYERVESSKQHQMMELEKQRMEFTKELEFERMNMLMDAQLELVKQSLKRPSPGSGHIRTIDTLAQAILTVRPICVAI